VRKSRITKVSGYNRLANAGAATELDEAVLIRRLIQRGNGIEPGKVHAGDRRANSRQRHCV